MRFPVSCRFAVAALLVGAAASAQAPDDPFYDWDLPSYRLFRSPDDPTGGILPLPEAEPIAGTPPALAADLRLETASARHGAAADEEDGRRIRDGARLYQTLAGRWSLAGGFAIDLAGRWTLGDGGRSGGAWLDRGASWRGGRTLVQAGMSRAFWGDGTDGSLLLGRTAPPLDRVEVRSIRPWMLPGTKGIGRLHGSIFLAYLDDRHRTIPYPLLQGTRLEWEPSAWLRLAAARTILFGGLGRTEHLSVSELWNIWIGRNENARGARTHADSDQKASLFFEVRLPPRWSPFSWLDGARFAYEYAGEDAFEGLVPTAAAHHIVGAVGVLGWIAQVETAETIDDANWWYVNHSVFGPDSYFHRDYLLGHPMGHDRESGTLRLWSPPFGAHRLQSWFRALGFDDRAKREVVGWRYGAGLQIRRDIGAGIMMESGYERHWNQGGNPPIPDPPVGWRWTLAVRRGTPFAWNARRQADRSH